MILKKHYRFRTRNEIRAKLHRSWISSESFWRNRYQINFRSYPEIKGKTKVHHQLIFRMTLGKSQNLILGSLELIYPNGELSII
jgi:hypothetical protein